MPSKFSDARLLLAILVMMGRSLALVVFVAGCDHIFSIEIPPPDAPMVAPAHDEDGDGVLDTVDDCPITANPPSAAGAAQDDFDGDGVGDACDPHPMAGGDYLAGVEYFVGSFGQAWRPAITDGWVQLADAVLSPAPPASGSVGHLLQRQTLQASVPTIDVAFRIVDLGPLQNGNHIELRLDTAADAARCRIEESLTDGNSRLEVDSSLASFGMNFTPELAAGQTHLVRLSRDLAAHHCRLLGTDVTVTNNDPTGAVLAGAIELIDVQIEIQAVAIYAVR